MKTVGIICEYNPFHLGHAKQLRLIREQFGSDCAVVCLMSGNYVQRGFPAIVDKSLRAQAALSCGADLVLELPLTNVLSSAEGFAAGGVEILSRICDTLCFGTESGTKQSLTDTASVLLSPEFKTALLSRLDAGLSFPAAREAAVRDIGGDASLLADPNNILGVEYCKAILSSGAALDIFPVIRMGSYHAVAPDQENPSATAIRRRMEAGEPWESYVPDDAAQILRPGTLHTVQAGERAILGKLRTMTDGEFEELPFGSEGLWRKFMHACREKATLDEILQATKSKRYTRTRLDRMVMCAFLGITREMMGSEIPYVRILGFRERGREVLNRVKHTAFFRNVGEAVDDPYWELERRAGNLYGLFAVDRPEFPGTEERRRVIYLK